MNNDIFTLDDNNNAAIRTVSVNAGASETNSPVIFTTDENGNAAVRIVGNGGGGSVDPHNLGYFATSTDLETAYPTAEAGDYASVVETGTIWVWDSTNSEWIDSEAPLGAVTSVNGQRGAVVLDAEDVGALPDSTVIPDPQVQADWNQSNSSAVDYIKNKPTIPTDAADIDAVPQLDTMPTAGSTYENVIVQFSGTTDASYTNGYFYKCTSTASSISASQTTGTSLSDVAVVKATFEEQITTTGTYAFTYDGADWSLNSEVVDLTDYGISFTGTPEADDVITVDYTAVSYAWGQVNVQPQQTINYPVTSVNTKTGAVVLDASDVGAQPATTVTTVATSTLTQELASDTIYDCGEMTSMTLTLPATIDAKFISQLNFTSGSTPTSITAPNTVVWLGNDITGGVFVPVASKRYCVLFFYDGTAVRGLVQGA